MLGLAAACWVVALRQMGGMDMGVATRLGSLPFFLAAWVPMMTAMPGAAPAVPHPEPNTTRRYAGSSPGGITNASQGASTSSSTRSNSASKASTGRPRSWIRAGPSNRTRYVNGG
jgi:hypothetical protein